MERDDPFDRYDQLSCGYCEAWIGFSRRYGRKRKKLGWDGKGGKAVIEQ